MALFKIYTKAKPIFVIRFPKSIPADHADIAYSKISNTLVGYYVLAYRDKQIKEVQFECYNCEFNEIEFNELKEKLLKTISDE